MHVYLCLSNRSRNLVTFIKYDFNEWLPWNGCSPSVRKNESWLPDATWCTCRALKTHPNFRAHGLVILENRNTIKEILFFNVFKTNTKKTAVLLHFKCAYLVYAAIKQAVWAFRHGGNSEDDQQECFWKFRCQSFLMNQCVHLREWEDMLA